MNNRFSAIESQFFPALSCVDCGVGPTIQFTWSIVQPHFLGSYRSIFVVIGKRALLTLDSSRCFNTQAFTISRQLASPCFISMTSAIWPRSEHSFWMEGSTRGSRFANLDEHNQGLGHQPSAERTAPLPLHRNVV